MEGYLGEETIDISKTEYSMYSKEDWVLMWIERYSGIDGSHHKDWLIDQIARIVKGTKIILKVNSWDNGHIKHKEERFSLEDPPEEYWEWVVEMKDGEDGPDTYDYDFGIAP